MNEQIIWMLAGVGCLILAIVAFWVLSMFIDWIYQVAIEWRSKSFDSGEASVRMRIIEASTWFSDPALSEMIRDLAIGQNSIQFIRDEYERKSAVEVRRKGEGE